MVHYSPLRPRREVVLEVLNITGRTFRQSFDCAIRTVTHVTNNLMSRGCSLRKETITYPLHFTSN